LFFIEFGDHGVAGFITASVIVTLPESDDFHRDGAGAPPSGANLIGTMDQHPEFDRSDDERRQQNLTRTLIWIGVAGLGAALAFTVVRVLLSRRPADPTSERIQQLIDEANHLLKTLDEQRTSA
jgi:hypothetical protein